MEVSMRIVVSAETDAGLDASVNGHFGGSPYFTLVEVTDGQIEASHAFANPHYPQHEPGAIPAFIHGQGAEVVLTGGMGSRAAGFFRQYGIQPVTGAAGTVREAVQAFSRGELAGNAPCHATTHGCGDEHGHVHHHGAQ
jgi:predicted Fe-Mo cluster-binding NifX family protein